MSYHYEVVLGCFLRDDTPGEVLDALRWHLGLADERPAGLDPEEHEYRMLDPDPESRLPGGDFAALRLQGRGFTADGPQEAWGLFSRNLWLDDMMGDLATLLDLIAPHVREPGHGGHVREEFDTEPNAITFRDGTYGPLTF
ncbi:hypothetical protein [Kitasatospora sp. NPDC096140]|uniref:hypothetical protein n=1 Tax=unclassified Kitasatospora TaxID=2633591 RepID=UPI00332674C0